MREQEFLQHRCRQGIISQVGSDTHINVANNNESSQIHNYEAGRPHFETEATANERCESQSGNANFLQVPVGQAVNLHGRVNALPPHLPPNQQDN